MKFIKFIFKGLVQFAFFILVWSLATWNATNNSSSSTKTSSEVSIYPITAEFTKGYSFADAADYLDTSTSETKLQEQIWIEGTIIGRSCYKLEKNNTFLECYIVQQSNGKYWIACWKQVTEQLDYETYTYNEKTNGVGFNGVYIGTTKDEMPIIICNQGFFKSSGKIKYSNLYNKLTESSEANSLKAESTENETNKEISNGLSKEFKNAMDEYETFFDKYIEFMKSYNSSDINQVSEYLQLLEEYTKTIDEFNKLGETDMTNEEVAYYTEVSLRISEKLLNASLTMH